MIPVIIKINRFNLVILCNAKTFW